MLYQTSDIIFRIACQKVDGSDLDKGEGTIMLSGFHAVGSTGAGHHYLTCQRWIVDGHVELETLVVGCAADS